MESCKTFTLIALLLSLAVTVNACKRVLKTPASRYDNDDNEEPMTNDKLQKDGSKRALDEPCSNSVGTGVNIGVNTGANTGVNTGANTGVGPLELKKDLQQLEQDEVNEKKAIDNIGKNLDKLESEMQSLRSYFESNFQQSYNNN